MNKQHPRSFIIANFSQINNIELLQTIGFGNEYILRIYEIIGDDPKQVLVAEPVLSLDNFFAGRLKSFKSQSDEEKSRLHWWKYVVDDFTTIFGGVVQGLIYLDSLDYICGDVYDSIYVTAEKG
ncbi:hypothetical protein RND81_06G031300 [Saponaria officinalis]|uniref:Uncharacterized protein n=1 Tax=Saponaria officinalis TaxID=3572 RepID=A0AAW1K3Y7_SAPOF